MPAHAFLEPAPARADRTATRELESWVRPRRRWSGGRDIARSSSRAPRRTRRCSGCSRAGCRKLNRRQRRQGTVVDRRRPDGAVLGIPADPPEDHPVANDRGARIRPAGSSSSRDEIAVSRVTERFRTKLEELPPPAGPLPPAPPPPLISATTVSSWSEARSSHTKAGSYSARDHGLPRLGIRWARLGVPPFRARAGSAPESARRPSESLRALSPPVLRCRPAPQRCRPASGRRSPTTGETICRANELRGNADLLS